MSNVLISASSMRGRFRSTRRKTRVCRGVLVRQSNVQQVLHNRYTCHTGYLHTSCLLSATVPVRVSIACSESIYLYNECPPKCSFVAMCLLQSFALFKKINAPIKKINGIFTYSTQLLSSEAAGQRLDRKHSKLLFLFQLNVMSQRRKAASMMDLETLS